jgi:DNA helicase-2/ATP-dependent DNA helicase PcrA
MEARAARADVYNSPGWQRLATRQPARTMAAPAETRALTIDLAAASAYERGDRVFHQKFGYGTVLAVEGDKLTVRFDKAGEKHLVARFVTPAAAAGGVPF